MRVAAVEVLVFRFYQELSHDSNLPINVQQFCNFLPRSRLIRHRQPSCYLAYMELC